MATAVNAALAEIAAEEAYFLPVTEGYVHFLEQQDLKPQSREEFQQAHAEHQQRVDLLDAAKKALQALNDHGHPTHPKVDVSESVLNDAKQNADSVNSAFATLRSNAAETLGVTISAPEPK